MKNKILSNNFLLIVLCSICLPTSLFSQDKSKDNSKDQADTYKVVEIDGRKIASQDIQNILNREWNQGYEFKATFAGIFIFEKKK